MLDGNARGLDFAPFVKVREAAEAVSARVRAATAEYFDLFARQERSEWALLCDTPSRLDAFLEENGILFTIDRSLGWRVVQARDGTGTVALGVKAFCDESLNVCYDWGHGQKKVSFNGPEGWWHVTAEGESYGNHTIAFDFKEQFAGVWKMKGEGGMRLICREGMWENDVVWRAVEACQAVRRMILHALPADASAPV